MALVKRFDMKGMYQGQNRQSPPENYFRRATNVWQDRSNTYRPVYPMGIQLGDESGLIIQTLFTKYFQGKIFQGYGYDEIGDGIDSEIADWYRTVDIDGNIEVIDRFNSFTFALSQSGEYANRDRFSSTIVDQKLYFTNNFGQIQKFDGFTATVSSIPTPIVGCAQYSTSGIQRWVKVIQVRVGLDGELVSSQDVTFPVNATSIDIDLRDNAADLVGQSEVTPTFRQTKDSLPFGNDSTYSILSGSATYNGLDEITVPTSSFAAAVGTWIVYKDVSPGVSTQGFFYAFKVKSISGSNLILDVTSARVYSRANLTWEKTTVSGGGISVDWTSLCATNTFQFGTLHWALIYSTSDANKNGAYTLRNQLPVWRHTASGFYPSTVSLTIAPILQELLFAGQITTDLGSWYDVGTTKLPTNSLLVKGVTNYQNLLVAYDDNAIYYSDTTLGGSVEMLNGLSNLVPPGEEYGKIVCVEGCEDFIFISRERKNYVVVGDIVTGNIRIEEVNPEVLGAFSSRSAIAVLGGIVFVSRQGVFYVNSAGTTKELSSDISRLFGTNFAVTEDPDQCIFNPYKMTDKNGAIDGNIVSLKYDADRALLAVMFSRFPTASSTGWGMETSLGVYNLNNGSWYEWSGDGARDIEFLPKYSARGVEVVGDDVFDVSGRFEGSLILASNVFKKESIIATNATGTEARQCILATQWQSLGEPSLEKQLTQFKWWGELQGCFISHQEDWEEYVVPNPAPIGNLTRVQYNSVPGAFIHKQRMNSSRAQVFSILINFFGLPIFKNWYFEGYELEGNLIQEGMKK